MKIVVFPGLDGTGQLLHDFADALSADHRVEVLSYPVDLTSYGEIAEWLASQPFDGEFAIVGESFSGPLAIDIAATKPDGLKAAVFVATFANAPRHVPKLLIKLMKIAPVPPLALAWLSLPFVMGRAGTAELRSAYLRVLRGIPRQTILGRIEAVLTANTDGSLPKIAVPCAYMRANRDRLVPRSASDVLVSTCDVVLPVDAPHFLLQTRPAEAARLVTDFLSRQPQ